MKQSLTYAAIFSTVLYSHAFAADSDKQHEWYLGLDVLASAARDSNVKGTNSGTIKYDNSVDVSAFKIGYRPEDLYGNTGDMRFELELAVRSVDVNHSTSGGVATPSKASLETGAAMINALYDLHTGTSITPYIGAGAGVGSMRFDRSPGLGIGAKDDSHVLAAGQAMAGLSYVPEAWPRTSWSLGYNVFVADKTKFKSTAAAEKLNALVVNSVQLGAQYHF